MPNPYNPNPYNEDQDRARQQPLYDQPGGPRQDARQEYHKGDGVFQIPWWVIVITFCFAAWPIGVAMMIINHLLRMGKISAPQSWSQNNRQTGQPYTARPIYADPQKAEKMRRDAQRVVQRVSAGVMMLPSISGQSAAERSRYMPVSSSTPSQMHS